MSTINTLYLVDDDPTFQFLTRKVIEGTSLVKQIRIFDNGQAAINFLQIHAEEPELLPEIILLDLFMPILDGWGFLDEFISIKPRIGKPITIYVVSSSIDVQDLVRASHYQEVSDYIVKPVTRDKFISMIKAL